jgi:predicted O-methyltransferase YrrM
MNRWLKFRTADFALIAIIGAAAAVAIILFSPGESTVPAVVVSVELAGLVIFCYRGLLNAQMFYSEQAEIARTKLYRQVEALIWIHSRVPLPKRLPPMRGMAVSPDAAAVLIDLVDERRPRRILELGCGVSTLLVGQLLAKMGAGEIISIDQNAGYAGSFRAIVGTHGLANRVSILDAPMKTVRLNQEEWEYYDATVLQSLERASVDLLFVDGPPDRPGVQARYPALPLLKDVLSANAVIVVDDADRDNERAMVDRWLREYPGWKLERRDTEKGTVLLFRDQR